MLRESVTRPLGIISLSAECLIDSPGYCILVSSYSYTGAVSKRESLLRLIELMFPTIRYQVFSKA